MHPSSTDLQVKQLSKSHSSFREILVLLLHSRTLNGWNSFSAQHPDYSAKEVQLISAFRS